MSPNVRVVPALRGWVIRHRLPATVLTSTAVMATLFCAPATAQESPSAAEQPETPLDQKITLEIKVSSLDDLCKVLTQLSGVEFEARGSAGDRKVTVFARDRELGEVARGIAEVSHLYFGWVKEGEKKGRYVFYEDDQHKAEREAQIEEEDQQKAERRERETRWMLDAYGTALGLRAGGKEWDRIKREEPWVWITLVKNRETEGRAVEFVLQLPEAVLEGLGRGELYTTRFGDLSPGAQELLLDAFGLDSLDSAYGFPKELLPEASVDVGAGGEGIGVYVSSPKPTGAMVGGEVMRPRELYFDAALEIIAEEADEPEVRAEFAGLVGERRAEREAERKKQADQEREELLETYSDNPLLQKEASWPSVDLKPGDKRSLPEVLQMISDGSGLTVYSEHYMHRSRPAPRCRTEWPLWEYLPQLEGWYGIEWEAQDDVLHVTYRDWHKRLEGEVPEDVLARWRSRVQDNGRLDFFDLMEIAKSLSKEQARNLDEDDVLIGAAANVGIGSNHDMLRFLSSLSPQQIESAAAFLRLAELSQSQVEEFVQLSHALADPEPIEIDPERAGVTVTIAPLGKNDWGFDPLTELVTVTFRWSEAKKHESRMYLSPPKKDASEDTGGA